MKKVNCAGGEIGPIVFGLSQSYREGELGRGACCCKAEMSINNQVDLKMNTVRKVCDHALGRPTSGLCCEDELETLGMNRTMARRDSVASLKCDLIKVIMGIC